MPRALMLLLSVALAGSAAAQNVSTEAELRAAIQDAQPGAQIVLADGTYLLTARLIIPRGGSAQQRITVRAQNRRAAVVVSNGAEEAFQISQPYWSFEGLFVRVSADSVHGFKIDDSGHHTVLRDNVMELEPGAESGVKGAGSSAGPWPDEVLIEGNEIYFTQPTTYFLAEGIDAVAVEGWVIRNNRIHDIRTAAGGVAYGAFTKGNSGRTVIEGNLIWDCFIGLSLGGGGTDSQYVRNGSTTYEDRGGLIRNNMVLRSTDVSLYLYKSNGSQVYNNTFFDSFKSCDDGCSSIDVRLQGATADIRNNILDKPILDREGGTHTSGANLTLPSPRDAAWFIDPAANDLHLKAGTPPLDMGETLAAVTVDFDGTTRPQGAAYDIGAHERVGGGPPRDAGTPAPDAAPGLDARVLDASPGEDAAERADAGGPLDAAVPEDSDGGERARAGTSGGCQSTGCPEGALLLPLLLGLGLRARRRGPSPPAR